MKVALIHDWLTGMRGGEKCLEVFCEMFPEAPIYTLVHRPGSVSGTIESHEIHTSFLQRMPRGSTKYQRYLPLFPAAIERFDMRGYDLIFSSSHAVAKGVVVHPGATQICYCHTPMRYVWLAYEQYFGGDKYGFPTSWMLPGVATYLRNWDVVTASRVDHFIANAHNVAKRIKRYYNRPAAVVHPWADTETYQPDPTVTREDFCLIISAMVPYKRLDLAVEACRKLDKRLVIIGTGVEEKRLRKLAGPKTEFRGWATEAELVDMLRRAESLLFPGEEDFGIVPVEAMACGTPVVAYGKGGVLETVIDGVTGIYFREQTVDSLADAIERVSKTEFRLDKFRSRAEEFSRERFRIQIGEQISAVMR
jgi:glycosyltransferase involved in cell wall biosynthesis